MVYGFLDLTKPQSSMIKTKNMTKEASHRTPGCSKQKTALIADNNNKYYKVTEVKITCKNLYERD